MSTATPQWADLARAVDESQGAFTTTMKVLRTMAGAQRMSEDLGSEIGNELRRRGYGHRPETLPLRQEDTVMIYRLGSMGAEVFSVLEDGIRRNSDFATLAEGIRMINAANEESGQDRLEARLEMSPERPSKGRRSLPRTKRS